MSDQPKKRLGRPLKYAHFLEVLEDDEIYTPARIVLNGEERGFITGEEEKERRDKKLRIRHTLARMSNNHKFPIQGDGTFYQKGHAPMRGWHGRRWKAVLENPLPNDIFEKGGNEAA